MDNLQNVGNVDIFNKKVYILDQSIISLNNENWIVDIIGIMNDKTFNYSRINLTIALLSSNSQVKIENISCSTENLYKDNDSLNCFSEKEMRGVLESAASDLGKDILVVNILKTSNNTIDFASNNINNRFYVKRNKRLSSGVIVAIVLVLSFVLIITGIMLILLKKRVIEYDTRDKRVDSTLYIMNNQIYEN
jgi:tetrahydromethanopterin S-methyltransferase subunit F